LRVGAESTMDTRVKTVRAEMAAVTAAAVVLVSVLLTRPVIGVADNGDFARIMGATGLSHISQDYNDRYFGYVNREYRADGLLFQNNGYFSTLIPLVRFAVLADRILTGGDLFDIRLLALIYISAFLFSIYLIARYAGEGRAAAWLTALALVVVFCDIGYISYFNSLYGEPLSLVSMLLMTGAAVWLLRQNEVGMGALAVFFIAAFALAGAKVQNSPLGLLAAMFGFRLRNLRPDRKWRLATLVIPLLLACFSIAVYFSVPDEIKKCNKYQAVFYGILKDSPTSEKDLEELGIDPRFAVLAGTDYFMKSYPMDIRAPELEKELYGRISHGKVVLFYLRHPSRYLQKLERTAEAGFILRHGYGNFEKAPGVKYGDTADIPAIWSGFKKSVIPNTLSFVMLFYATCFAVLLILREIERSGVRRAFIEYFIIIGLAGIIQFLVPGIGDGEADLGRHLFLFNVCFDIIFAAGTVWLASAVLKLGARFMRKCTMLLANRA